VEADDDGMYVAKFRGAGQGAKVLVAELLCGEIGRALGLPIPDIVFLEVDPVLSKAEPDPEIQDLLRSSSGLNIGLDYLPGSLAFAPGTNTSVDPDWAAEVVWFDAFIMNVDRTPRNVNMLVWHGKPWLIDHGAALYVHHAPTSFVGRASAPFPQVADHVLLPCAGSIASAADRLAPAIAGLDIPSLVSQIPDDWLDPVDGQDRAAIRRDYVDFLEQRLVRQQVFVEEADRARSRAI
jgi:hypothetical protein